MNVWEAVFLGFLQGATEFLPVSSSGHLVAGQMDLLQPGNQEAAARAQSLGRAERSGDNSQLVVGGMRVEEWKRRRAEGSA